MKKILCFLVIMMMALPIMAQTTRNVPGTYATIQAAIDASADGDIIQLAAGTYVQTATLTISKQLSIVGTDVNTVIINVAAVPANAWGVKFSKSNSALKNVTIIPRPADGGFPVHISGADNSPKEIISNITVENVKVNGAKRTGIDVHGVDNVTLTNIVSTNATGGNGVQITGCNNVTISNVTTSGNAWGGVAVYCSKPEYFGRGSSNVTINGTSCSISDVPQIYSEKGYGFENTNIIVNGYSYQTRNSFIGTLAGKAVNFSNYVWYHKTLQLALDQALGFNQPDLSAVCNSIGDHFVKVGMSIQYAIDAAEDGSTINIYAGNYGRVSTGNRYVQGTNGPHKFGLYIAKNNITLKGLDASGNPITDPNNASVEFTTNSTANFGPSGVFVEGAGVTLEGLKVGNNYNDAGVINDNKTIEVVGDNFTIRYCWLNPVSYGSLYLGKWETKPLESYNIANNRLSNSLISINNGVGLTPLNNNRGIVNNIFDGSNAYYGIAFRGWNGANPVQGWIVQPVGGARISGNQFPATGYVDYIRVRGNEGGYTANEFNWSEIWSTNTFGNAAITLSDPATFTPRTYTDAGGYPKSMIISDKIQSNVNLANDGDILLVKPGTYTEQVDVTKSVEIRGANYGINPNTGSRLTESMIQLTNNGRAFTVKNGNLNVVVDGFSIEGGSPLHDANYTTPANTSSVTFKNNIVTNGINLFSGSTTTWADVVIEKNRFTNYVTSPTFQNPSAIQLQALNSAKVNHNFFKDIYYAGILLDNITSVEVIGNTLENTGYQGIQLANTIGNAVVEGNSIKNANFTSQENDRGAIRLYGSDFTGNVVIRHNTIQKGYTGIAVRNGGNITGKSIVFSNNSITELDGGFAAFNGAVAGTLNAKNNWWGSSDPTVIVTKISGNVDFDPYIGKAEPLPVTNAAPQVTYPTAGATLNFTTLPAGTNATVTVTRTESNPTSVPVPDEAGTVAPVFLQIQAPALVNNTFEVTITLDVSNIPNFSANTKVLYLATGATVWTAVTGTYDPVAKTFTFTTTHFTDFAFVNPTNPIDLYVTKDAAVPATNLEWFPSANDNTFGVDDWKYNPLTGSFFVTPAGTQSVKAAEFVIEWNHTLASVSVTEGDLFGADKVFQTQVLAPGKIKVNYASLAGNIAPVVGKYFAKIDFTVTKPGFNSFTLSGVDVRYYDAAADEQKSVFTTTHPAAARLYLGDFASAAATNTGDGVINFTDLNIFAAAYWKISPAAGYMKKFDIGPTNSNGSYFAMPTPDGKINFEDLVIYSIGHGKSAANQLPKNGNQPVTVDFGTIAASNGITRIPVTLSGAVVDLRALSLQFTYSGMKFVGVEKAGDLDVDAGFVVSNDQNSTLMVDAAIIGLDNSSINKEGTILNLLFEGNGSVSVVAADGRYSDNNPMSVKFAANSTVGALPVSFGMDQNYPNPFNPSTTISYQLPKQAMVNLAVYNALGEKVATLVSQMQDAGYYTANWSATQFASGIYFCRIEAGDFVAIKKMILMK